MYYISLGNTCGVAYQLKKHGLRNHAFPFDWLKTPKLSTIIKLLENKFDGLLDKSNFKFVKYSDKFFNSNGNNQMMALYKNTIYNIIFYHDFIKDSNFDDQFIIFKEKYQRRITRFYDILNSNEIVFIRDDLYDKININQINHLMKLLRGKLILIIHNPNNRKIDIEIDNIVIYNDIEVYHDWKRDNLEWKKILKN
jgi:hypothetical protein